MKSKVLIIVLLMKRNKFYPSCIAFIILFYLKWPQNGHDVKVTPKSQPYTKSDLLPIIQRKHQGPTVWMLTDYNSVNCNSKEQANVVC